MNNSVNQHVGSGRGSNATFRKAALLIAAVMLIQSVMARPVNACLWDYETILQERERMPGILEIIVGKFPRHSTAFYEWRLRDRKESLRSDSTNDRLLDDVAVSLEKLGRYDEAIEVALEQLKRNPDRYETLANLGTFLIHAGRYQEGADKIAAAIEINPDAHFGREEIQYLLVKYLIERQDADLGQKSLTEHLPLNSLRRGSQHYSEETFNRFLAIHWSDGKRKSLDQTERQRAIEGVTGMMRFSRHDSPILLEVLGHLLESDNAHRMAVRCYLLAAENAPNEAARRYRQFAKWTIMKQHDRDADDNRASIEPLKARLDAEMADASDWFAKVTADERAWIEAGQDVEAKFQATYRDAPEVVQLGESNSDWAISLTLNQSIKTLRVIGASLGAIATILAVWVIIRRNKKFSLTEQINADR